MACGLVNASRFALPTFPAVGTKSEGFCAYQCAFSTLLGMHYAILNRGRAGNARRDPRHPLQKPLLCSAAHGGLPVPPYTDHAATSMMMPSAEFRGTGKEASMIMRHGTAQLLRGRADVLLVILLLLVLVAALALAANTPWVLDQPLSPYDWAIVP